VEEILIHLLIIQFLKLELLLTKELKLKANPQEIKKNQNKRKKMMEKML